MHGARRGGRRGAGYLLGSFPSADAASRVATHGDVDLRSAGVATRRDERGEGARRRGWGAAVLVVDLAKGVVPGFAGTHARRATPARTSAATVVIAGHIAPPWSRFRGGKGVATSAARVSRCSPSTSRSTSRSPRSSRSCTRRSELAAQVSGVASITAAIVWSAASLPNGMGPAPGPGLIAFTVAGVGDDPREVRADTHGRRPHDDSRRGRRARPTCSTPASRWRSRSGAHIVIACTGMAFPFLVRVRRVARATHRRSRLHHARPALVEGAGGAVRDRRGVGHDPLVRVRHPVAALDGGATAT